MTSDGVRYKNRSCPVCIMGTMLDLLFIALSGIMAPD